MDSNSGSTPPRWMPRSPLGCTLAAVGLGPLFVGATTRFVALALVAVALAPIAIWLAWNVLDFVGAIGAPELGLWGILLLIALAVTALLLAVAAAPARPQGRHSSQARGEDRCSAR